MAIRLAIQELAATVIGPDGPGEEVRKIVKAEVGYLVFAILNVQLRVIDDSAEGHRMTAAQRGILPNSRRSSR